MKRIISNEEFEKEYKNPDNIKIIKMAMFKTILFFRKRYNDNINIDYSTMKAWGQFALWKALSYYSPNHKSKCKFSSFLFRITTQVCASEYKKIKPLENTISLNKLENILYINIDEFNNYIDGLDEDDQNILRDKFISHKTYKEIGLSRGICSESARKKTKKILSRLKSDSSGVL